MSPKRNRIPCALIGTGRIGSSLELDKKREKPASHAGAINHNPDTFIAAGCDNDAEALQAFGKQWKLSPEQLFTDAEQMLEQIRPRILHIATHPDSHLEYIRLAVRHEIPVVVCEKPVSELEDLDKARELEKELLDTSTRVLINHERRFSRDYLYVRDCIARKIHGDLLSISCRLYMGRTRTPGKVLWHDGTHLVDIIHFLTGRILEIQHVSGDPESDTSHLNILTHAGNIAVNIDCSPRRDHLQFELDLSFEQGRIRVGNALLEEYKSIPSPYYEHFRSLKSIKTPRIRKTGYFSGMAAHAVQLLKEPERQPRSSLSDGIAAISVIKDIINETL